jgi:hypothetical protein
MAWNVKTLLLWIIAAGPIPHVLPNETIHRNIQVVVFKDTVEVTLEVGMNDDTVIQLGKLLDAEQDWNLTELALSRQFTEIAARPIGKGLTLTIDGENYPLTLVDEEPAGKHHQTSRFVYRAKVTNWKETSQLKLVDGNWVGLKGQARVALKGKGVRVADSNSALLVVRAEPIELDELTEKERTEMLTIRAVIRPSAVAGE